MPKGSEELTSARKEEILNACAALYETMSFRDITLRDIGERTSFTRTSIYNYFQTKEEIFLALLQREHERWAEDLEAVLLGHTALSPGEFAGELARTLERRGCMLKLMSMNLYDMEGNSRMENLVAFKRAYAGALGAVTRCLEKFFPADKIVVTGNPVRQDLEEARGKREEALAFFGLSPERKTILVVGGSLGARTINRSVQGDLDKFFASDVQVIWQTGRYYYNDASRHLKAYRGMPIWCSDFITRMDYAYAAADLVISRAGAGSISELCLLGKPVILVPSPNVAEDHQTKNALALVERDAAVMIADKDAERELVPTALRLVGDADRLAALSRNIQGMAQRHSAERIVDEIVRIIEKR